MNAVKWLVAELQNVRAKDEPTGEVKETDIVAGVLPEDLRPFYSFMSAFVDQTNEKLAVLYKEREAECKKNRPNMDVLRRIKREEMSHASLGNCVTTSFWASVRQTFPDAIDRDNLTIRKGWQVVSAMNEEKRTMVGFAMILG